MRVPMSTVFRRNITEGTWTAEVPCPWQGQCELEVADSQTSETLGRFAGFSDGDVAKFEIPLLRPGAVVRFSVRKGDRSMAGLCRLPTEQQADSEPRFEIGEAELPLRKIQEALPGILVDNIRGKIGDGLAVGESSPMFAAVSSMVNGLMSCRLVGVSDDGTFRFEVQFAAAVIAQEAGQ